MKNRIIQNSIIHRLLFISVLLALIPLLALAFFAQFATVTVFFLLLCIPLVLILFYTTLFVKRRIIQPIEQVSESEKRISAGDLTQSIQCDDHDDELGKFIQSFDEMRKTLLAKEEEHRRFEQERRQFISNISHDLRTPISSISAYLEALQDGVADSEEEELRYYRIMKSKLDLLTNLSSQLRFSYLADQEVPLRLQMASCYSWCRSWIEEISSECVVRNIPANLQNHIQQDESFSMKIDPMKLDRALQNILNNAYRYAKDLFSIDIARENASLILRIKNDGCRITQEQTEHIFDRFFTGDAKNENGHLGLGLYISKTLLSAMGIGINATVKQENISFQIRIPLIPI